MGVDVIDGTVVAANMIESSPSSISISAVHIKPTISDRISTTDEEISSTQTNIQQDTISDRNTNISHFVSTPSTTLVKGGLFVNAAGAWGGKLVQMFASTAQRPFAIAPLPVQPRKRCIFTVHCPTTTAAGIPTNSNHKGRGGKEESILPPMGINGHPIPPVNTPLVIDPSGVYFRPEGSYTTGKYLMGVSPSDQNDPDCSDNENVLDYVDQSLFDDIIWPVLYHRIPGFEVLKVTSSWAGFYEYNTIDQVNNKLLNITFYYTFNPFLFSIKNFIFIMTFFMNV